MDHLAVACVEPHMANASVEEDQIPVPELGLRDLLANAVLLSGRMRELDASGLPGLHRQTRAIPTVGPRSGVRVSITELLLGKGKCLLALGSRLRCLGNRLAEGLLDHNLRGGDLAGLQRLPEGSG